VVPSTYIVPLGCVECEFSDEGCSHCYDKQHESVLTMNALSDIQDTRPSGLPGMLRETSSLLGHFSTRAPEAMDEREVPIDEAMARAHEKLELVDAELDRLRHEIQLMVEAAAEMMPDELAEVSRLESITVALSRPGQWDDESMNFEYSFNLTPPVVHKASTPKAAAATSAATVEAQVCAALTVKHEPDDGLSHRLSHESAAASTPAGADMQDPAPTAPSAGTGCDAAHLLAALPVEPVHRADEAAARAAPSDTSSPHAPGALSGSSDSNAVHPEVASSGA
jgi:hypothetical protein